MNARVLMMVPLLWFLGPAPFAVGQTTSAAPSYQKATNPTAASSVGPEAKSIQDLHAAAQNLQDIIHDMLTAPAGPKRTELIKAGDRALAEVDSAMTKLPPELLIPEATEYSYKHTADRLQRATQNLHDAVETLEKDPYSKRRNATVMKIKGTLHEMHRLMHEIPRGASSGNVQ